MKDKELLDCSFDLVSKHEGLRLKSYICPAGKLTIGYGRNIEEAGISKAEAKMLLYNDLMRVITLLEKYFAEWHSFSNNRKCALIDMAINLGWNGFLRFKKMIKAIIFGDWEKAADEAKDSNWFNQVGSRSETIVKMLREG